MSDVEGSTRLWESKTEAMRLDVRALDEMFEGVVRASGGCVLKERGEGDSHFCVFTNPRSALQAAVHLQRLLATHPWQIGAPLKARMGIHSALTEPSGDDYYGPEVNRCARIRSAGHGGQVLVSQGAFDGLKGESSGWSLHDLGLHRLLDLSEPQRIYQVQAQGLKEKFAPLRSLNAVKHNLPVQLTSFVGRESELRELHGLLDESRLLTLLGPGGAGKTRIALQLAAESIDSGEAGVWFVDLSSLRDGSKLAQKVVEELYISAGPEEPIRAVVGNFQAQRALLLLDNCEHLAREAAVFADRVLKECPNLRVLATSREPLGVAGERTYRLPPMGIQAEDAATWEEIIRLDSVRLLYDRTRARGYERVLTEAKPSVIVELCRQMDGIPLALEQVAANLGVLSPEAMLGRLNERLSLLTMREEGVQDRHQTLPAAIDWSYDALADDERALFLDLAVFVGGWTLEAAEAICESRQVVDLMSRLVAKSLVSPEVNRFGSRRFRLLETIREYTLEKRSPIPDSVCERHLGYYGHLAKIAERAGLDADDGHWSKALDADHSNILAAMNWAISHPSVAVEGLTLANNMYRYWLRRGYLREAATWLQNAIEAAPQAPDEIRAEALNILGIFAWYQAQLGPAQVALEASLAIWQTLGNNSRIGATLNNLALLANEREQPDRAIELLRNAIEMFEAVTDDERLSNALQNLSQFERRRGNLAEAISLGERALKLRRRMPDRLALAIIMVNVLGLYADAGRALSDTLDLLEDALTIAREVENPDLSSSVLDVVAFLARENEDLTVAAFLVGAAGGAMNETGIRLSDYTQEFRERLAQCLQKDMGRQSFRAERDKGASTPIGEALKIAQEYVNAL